MKRSLLAGSLVLGVLLLFTSPSSAQSRGGHGGGGGHSGGGHSGGGHSGGGHSGGGWHGGGHSNGGWHGGGRGGGWQGGGHGGGWHGGGRGGGWHGGGWNNWHGGGARWGYPRYGWGWGGWGWGWGWGGWGGWYSPYWGAPYGYGYGYGGYGGYGGGYYSSEAGPGWAVVNTDVSPDSARVVLDGRYIGTADDFDGFPDYLYLRKGTYKLEFQLEGFETKVVELDAHPNTMTKIDDKLHKIPGAKQYGSYDTPEPEGGVQRYFGKRNQATAPETAPGPGQYESQPPNGNSENGDEPSEPPRQPAAPSQPSSAPSDWRDHPQGSGAPSVAVRPGPAPSTRLTIQAEPTDAAVYLDDRFIGTAEELADQLRGVRVSPGRHRVTVSRPGYAEKTIEVEVEIGTTGSVKVQLER